MQTRTDFVSAIGPASDLLQNDFLNGYTQVDRVGEVVQTAMVHASLYSMIFGNVERKAHLQAQRALYTAAPFANPQKEYSIRLVKDEPQPPFHQWASVQPGMVAVAHKTRAAEFRNQVSSERSASVIVCAQGLSSVVDDKDYMFAGVTRTKSIIPMDDGLGPKVDETFTLSKRGKVTMLNNGPRNIHEGDMLEWTFDDYSSLTNPSPFAAKRAKLGKVPAPRAIVIQKATVSTARVFGVAMEFAKRGERVDVLLKS